MNMQITREVSREKASRFAWLQVLLTATIILHSIGLFQFAAPAVDSGILFISRKWLVLVVSGVSGILLEYLILILSWTRKANKINDLFTSLAKALGHLGWINILFAAALIALFSFLIYGAGLSEFISGIWVILSIFWLVALFGCLFLKAWSYSRSDHIQFSWTAYLVISVLITAFSYRIASFLPDISTYPFTLTWSETSRYYNASLFFSDRIYGTNIPPSVLHPSRYLLQAIPFLLPDSPLWLHRAWQVILWVGVTVVTSLVIVKRLSIKSNVGMWAAVLWIFLYLLVGPVYYHLQIPVIIVTLGFNRVSWEKPRFRSLISISSLVAASIWAGISRINWFPLPGTLAAIYWILEHPYELKETGSSGDGMNPGRNNKIWPLIRYSIIPAVLVITGTGIAFLAQWLYIIGSGHPALEFVTSFSSGLLWYRLWPNKTYPIGILPGILIISMPLVLLTVYRFREFHNRHLGFHPFRIFCLAAFLTVFFLGGLIVSVKIGGGSNLHNMDAFMVLLLITTASIYFQKVGLDDRIQSADAVNQTDRPMAGWNWTGLISAVGIVVVLSVLGRGQSPELPNQNQTEKALREVNKQVELANQRGGEILFISNRHLITFDYVKGVRLIPEYERVYLMEMAMAGNQDYLERFRKDLENQRFELIVIEPLYRREKDETAIFGEENNAWVTQVSRFVLCYYEQNRRSREVRIQFLIPIPTPGDCQ